MSTNDTLIRQALDKIEAARKRRGISIRDAAAKVQNISEGYWRQFMAGGVMQSGIWVPKTPTVEQVLKMAAAVGVAAEVAQDMGVEPPDGVQETVIDRTELEQLRADIAGILERIDQTLRHL